MKEPGPAGNHVPHSVPASAGVHLYFFPALLPLASVLPWLLTAVGALAGVMQTIRSDRWKPYRRAALVFTVICFSLAGGILGWQNLKTRSAREELGQGGSRLTPEASLPFLERFAEPVDAPAAPGPRRPRSRYQEAWFQLLPRKALSAPAVAGGLLLLGSQDGTLEAFSTSDGKRFWSLRKREPVFSAPLILKDRVFVGSGLHQSVTSSLTAVSLPQGTPLWQREFLGHVEMPPALVEARNQLLVATGPGGLWSLDARDGSVQWHGRIGHVDATPLVLGDLVIASAQVNDARKETILYGLDLKDGKERWKGSLPGQPWGVPHRDSKTGLILLTTGIGQLGPREQTERGWSHAVSARDGTLLWSVALPGMPMLNSVSDPKSGLVFHAVKSGELVALRITDGSRAWMARVGEAIEAPPALYEDPDFPLIAVISLEGNLSLRNARDGTEKQRFNLGEGGTSAPVFVGQRLYVVTRGSLAAYDPVPSPARETR